MTVAEMKTRMGHSEYVDWATLYKIEPFGPARIDYAVAQIMMLLANINRDDKKKVEPFNLFDFLPNWWNEDREVEHTGDSLMEKFMMISETINIQNAKETKKQHGESGRDTSDQAGR